MRCVAVDGRSAAAADRRRAGRQAAHAQRRRRRSAGQRVEDDPRRTICWSSTSRTAAGWSSSSRRTSRRSTSPTSRRLPAAAIGTARPSIACRTIMSRNGAMNESDKPLAGGRRRQAAGGIYAAAEGAEDQAARLARSLCAERRLRRRLAGRLQSEGRLGQSHPLLRHRRRRPRPVAGHRHGRRALRGHRPRPAPARPQHRRRRPGDRGHRHILARCRAGPRRSASTRTRRNMCRSRSSGWRATCPPRERPSFEYHGHEQRELRRISALAPTGTMISTSARRAASTCATCRCRCGRRR